jgi:hypothetical protein
MKIERNPTIQKWQQKIKKGLGKLPNPFNLVEAATGFEPVSNGFADRRLTTWLCRLWSGKRDLNPRLQPWQGCTLPLSYSRLTPKTRSAKSLAHSVIAKNPEILTA